MALEQVAQAEQHEEHNTYDWKVFEVAPDTNTEKETITVAQMTDPRTGFRLLTRNANPHVRTQALDAWAMTNHSRNPGDSLEIVDQIYEEDVDPDEKMGLVFNNYGHASVADQSQIAVDFNDVPMHVPFSLFNLGELNSGQEKSTRYQEEFGENTLHGLKNYLPPHISQEHITDLDQQYQSLGRLSLDLFAKNKQRDTARSHLLLGQGTGFGFKTNARDWARIIGTFKASPIPAYQALGEQLRAFLGPERDFEEQIGFKMESPQLVKYTDANTRVGDNLRELKAYISEHTDFTSRVNTTNTFQEHGLEVTLIDEKHASPERMAMQYVLRAWPGADGHEVLDWLHEQEDQVKVDIGKLIYKDHNHHYSISQKGRTTDIGARLRGSLAEARDWNRHRAWGRFIPEVPALESLPIDRETAQNIADAGYALTIYLTQNPELHEAKKHMVDGLQEQYDGLNSLLDNAHKRFGDEIDYGFALNLLPLGHKTDIWMHGDPRQGLYMTKLRVRPGGHINYRQQAWSLNQQLADSSPFLEGLRAEEHERPDATSRDQFFDRK